jgi:hypothetical protein
VISYTHIIQQASSASLVYPSFRIKRRRRVLRMADCPTKTEIEARLKDIEKRIADNEKKLDKVELAITNHTHGVDDEIYIKYVN